MHYIVDTNLWQIFSFQKKKGSLSKFREILHNNSDANINVVGSDPESKEAKLNNKSALAEL